VSPFAIRSRRFVTLWEESLEALCQETKRSHPNLVSEVRACAGGCWARVFRIDFRAVLPME
jgi:hypothetical protein